MLIATASIVRRRHDDDGDQTINAAFPDVVADLGVDDFVTL